MTRGYESFLPLSATHLLLPRIGKRMRGLVRYTWMDINEILRETGWPKNAIFSYIGGPIAMSFEDGVTLMLGYRPDVDSIVVSMDGVGRPPIKDEPGFFSIDAEDKVYSKKQFSNLVGCTLKIITVFRSVTRPETAKFPNQIGMGFSFESGGVVFGCGFEGDQSGMTLLGYDEIDSSARPLLREIQIAP